MPQYQIVDFGPDPRAQAAARFGEGFTESLKRAQKQKDEMDMLQFILNQNKSSNLNDINIKNNNSSPNNIQDLMHDISQNKTNLQNQGIVSGNAPLNNNKLTPEKLAAVNLINPQIGKSLQPIYESQQAKEKEGIKASVKRSGEYLQKVDTIRDAIPFQESAIKQIEEGLKNRTSLDFIGDLAADIPGLEFLRSPKGSQILTGAKELYLNTIKGVPSKGLNQVLEKTIQSALVDPKRKEESNLMQLAGIKHAININKEKARLTSEISNYYENSLGYIPGRLASDVDKALVTYADKAQDEWAQEVYDIQQKFNPEIKKFKKFINKPSERRRISNKIKLKQVPKGVILDEVMGMVLLDKFNDDSDKAIKAAKDLGYKIPGEE